jgi:hypothetical protein
VTLEDTYLKGEENLEGLGRRQVDRMLAELLRHRRRGGSAAHGEEFSLSPPPTATATASRYWVSLLGHLVYAREAAATGEPAAAHRHRADGERDIARIRGTYLGALPWAVERELLDASTKLRLADGRARLTQARAGQRLR